MKKELGYLVAAAAVSFLALAPLDLHDFPLDPRLRPYSECLAVVWIGIRLGVFLKRLEALAPVAAVAALVVRCGGPGV